MSDRIFGKYELSTPHLHICVCVYDHNPAKKANSGEVFIRGIYFIFNDENKKMSSPNGK